MSENINSKTRYNHISSTGKITPLQTREEALEVLSKKGYIWFDFVAPTREDLNWLMEPFSLHPLAIEDCLDEDQVPKIDDFSTNTFILFNSFEYIEKEFFIDEIDFFIGKNFIISVRTCHTGDRNFFSKLDGLISRNMENVKKGPDFLLHIIIDYIVDEKFKVIEAMQEELDTWEEVILDKPSSFEPAALLYLRKNLLVLRKSLFHEREILIKICRGDSKYVSQKAIYHFRDVYDHLARFFETIEIYREMITSLMEMYLSMINTQMARMGNRTNQVVRRLTLINTIFMPLTLLAGIGGMSEWTNIMGPGHWKFAYLVLLLTMVVIGFISYIILKRLEAKDKNMADSEIDN